MSARSVCSDQCLNTYCLAKAGVQFLPMPTTHNLLTDSTETRPLEASEHRKKDATVLHSLLTDRAAKSAEIITLDALCALSGDRMFGPLQVPCGEKVSQVVRRLQHSFFTANPDGVGQRFQLAWKDQQLDPSARLCHDYELTVIASPVLLSWDQLVAMPAMRKRSGRGGKGACTKQRQLRTWCFHNNIGQLDLSYDNLGYDWRLLLKTMPKLNTRAVIGPGIVQFMFRLLDTIDPNYEGNTPIDPILFYRPRPHWADFGQRHVFEMSCANGDRWHLHFHQHGNCDLEHLPFRAG